MHMVMTETQEHIIRHALGITNKETPYRNHFCTGPGSKDYDDCMALVDQGLMVRRDASALTGGDFMFHVTKAGIDMVMS
jgi:hypothetical protein